jgi:ABC-type glycerol-3-phosphate transport system substrate-binding protein
MRRTANRRSPVRNLRAATAVALAFFVVTACSSGDDGGDGGDGDGQVELSINGMPPETDERQRKVFLAEIAAFEDEHPDIKIVPHEGEMDPETFNTRVAGGQLEDVFYVYYTDPAWIIRQGYAADITDHLDDVPHLDQVKPELHEIFQDAEGRQYGLPTSNYSMGLLYNRELFEQAGLDPDDPPSTWEEVRAAAREIGALGEGINGYGEYSVENTGGWHFTAAMYSEGVEIAEPDGDGWKAAFNVPEAAEWLELLHAMRWEDGSMGADQLLGWEDLVIQMGAGQLGMYMAAPDNIPILVRQYDGAYENLGLAGIPGGQGSLLGGEGYMVNAKASEETIEAAVTWLQWRFLNPDRIEHAVQQELADDLPVGLPMPPLSDIWQDGAVRDEAERVKAENANIPVENVQPFLDASPDITLKVEPYLAQEVYSVLDNVMQGVLTDRNADIPALLDRAESQVNDLYTR